MTITERQRYHDADEPALAGHEAHINGSRKIKAVRVPICSLVSPVAIVTRLKLENSGAVDSG